jgi:hypothetical protein
MDVSSFSLFRCGIFSHAQDYDVVNLGSSGERGYKWKRYLFTAPVHLKRHSKISQSP